MLFSTPAVTIFTLALAFTANAQSSTSANATSTSGAPAATSTLAACVTKCQTSAAILAGCVGVTDIPCVCNIKKTLLFQTSMDNCITGGCGADAQADITAANQQHNSTCLAFASGLAGKSSASSTSGSSSTSNAAGSARPLAMDGVRAVGVAFAVLTVGAVFGAASL